jgi:hypothetical protein
MMILARGQLAVLSALTLCVIVVATNARSETPHSGMGQDVAGFCRGQGTMDYPEKTFFGTNYRDGMLPKPVQDTSATNWRCMDGEVFVCMNSASGDWCSRKDPSRKPSADIADFCADSPGSDYVTGALESYSASIWRCNGRKPGIVETWALDNRGFMRKMWLRMVIRNGVVVTPHPDDFGMR